MLKVDFFGNGTCTHCKFAKHELEDFLQFHIESENIWIARDDKLQDVLSDTLSNYPKEQHEDIVDSYSWDLHLNQQKYPDIHRSSLIITVFNFFENHLNSLCEILTESVESEVRLKDLNGKGITRAFAYLTKVARLNLGTLGAERPFIVSVNSIRNIIVHNGGLLPENPNDKIYKFIEKEIGISGRPECSVTIQYDFISRFIHVLIDFFDKLDDEIQAHIRRFNAKNNSQPD